MPGWGRAAFPMSVLTKKQWVPMRVGDQCSPTTPVPAHPETGLCYVAKQYAVLPAQQHVQMPHQLWSQVCSFGEPMRCQNVFPLQGLRRGR